MNQNLRDFSDRHFEVVFTASWYSRIGPIRETLWQFQRYEDASRFQKSLIYAARWSYLEHVTGLPPGQYIKLYGAAGPLVGEHVRPPEPKKNVPMWRDCINSLICKGV